MKFSVKLYSVFLFFLLSCGDGIDYYYDIIEDYGYHPYLTLLEKSGTGTLISGDTEEVALIAGPETCFPHDSEEPFRIPDRSTLPIRNKKFTIESSSKFSFMDGLASTSPSIRAGHKMKEVHEIDFVAEGVHIEYLDTAKILQFYRDEIDSVCFELLQGDVNIVSQVIKVERMTFTFHRKGSGKIFLDLENVNQYVDFSGDIKWRIEEGFKLVIETPKYIAYQLARIKTDSEGKIKYYRSDSKGKEDWSFYKVLTLEPGGDEIANDFPFWF